MVVCGDEQVIVVSVASVAWAIRILGKIRIFPVLISKILETGKLVIFMGWRALIGQWDVTCGLASTNM